MSYFHNLNINIKLILRDIMWDKDSMFYYEALGYEKDKMPVNYEKIKDKKYT